MVNTSLGFLYQTPTILRTCPYAPSRFWVRTFCNSASRSLRHRPGRQRTLDRDIQADIAPGYDATSTLTPVESQKFRAIFEAAAKGLPPPSLQNPSNAGDQVQEEAAYEIGTSLDNTFETAAAESSRLGGITDVKYTPQPPEETSRTTAAKAVLRDLSPEFPAALQGAWRDVRRAMAVDMQQLSTDQSIETEVFQNHLLQAIDADIRERRETDVTQIRERFASAKSDSEIWSTLETEVFPRVRALITIVKARLETNAISSVGRSAKGPRKGKQARKKSSKKNAESNEQMETEAAIIQSTYSLHLLNAIRALRSRFPRSPYALALVPSVKKLDTLSQIIGLSTELYNELLYISWRQHSNVFECARVVEDMNSQGLVGDTFTTAVFVDAEREMTAAQEEPEVLSVVRAAWWQLPSVLDSMKRWSAAMDTLDARAEEERLYREQWGAEEPASRSQGFESDSDASPWQKKRRGFFNEEEAVAQAANPSN